MARSGSLGRFASGFSCRFGCIRARLEQQATTPTHQRRYGSSDEPGSQRDCRVTSASAKTADEFRQSFRQTLLVAASTDTAARDLSAEVAAHQLWYHTMELAPGVVTPGWFDLRPVIDRLPWPDVRGKRCLDVGTFDGHLAFELERRGAGEVVCTDLASEAEWDWPAESRRSVS